MYVVNFASNLQTIFDMCKFYLIFEIKLMN